MSTPTRIGKIELTSIMSSGTSEGVKKEWDTRGRGRKQINSNGWISSKGKWMELPDDGSTHSTFPNPHPGEGSPDVAVKKGWIRVIREEPYWSYNKTGKTVLNFEFAKSDDQTVDSILSIVKRLHPSIEKVGLQGGDYKVVDPDVDSVRRALRSAPGFDPNFLRAGADGTKLTGYIVNKKAMPEKCSNCEHYLGKPPDFDSFGLCTQKNVLKDDDVPTDKKTGNKNVDGEFGWCKEWEHNVQASGTSEGALKGWDVRGRGVKALDEIPEKEILKAPGQAPIPPGTIRLYHFTGGEGLDEVRTNLASIVEHGLRQDRAKGASYGEPSVVWGSTAKPHDFKYFVEFYAKPDELDIGRPSGTWKEDPETHFSKEQPLTQDQIDEFNKGNHDVTLRGDVPPERIVAVHEPWHKAYQYIAESDSMPQEIRNGDHNALMEGRWAESDDGIGILQWIKRHPEDAPKTSIRAYGTSEGVKKEWDERGRGRHEDEGAVFVSPNEEEDTKFDTALKGLRTAQHKGLRSLATKVITEVDHGGDVTDAVGDWSDGAENALVVQPHTNDPQKIKLMGAMLGLQSRQKYVIPWVTDKNGSDRLYHFNTNQNLQQVRSTLDNLGVQFRTLAQGANNSTTVYVFDQGNQLADTMGKVAEQYGDIKVARGKGEFFGDDDRNKAGNIFRTFIEGQNSGRNRGVGRQRDDYNWRSPVQHQPEIGNRVVSPLAASTAKLRGLLEQLKGYGTSVGVKKAWDERGRGRHPKETTSTPKTATPSPAAYLTAIKGTLQEGGFRVGEFSDLSDRAMEELHVEPIVPDAGVLAAAKGARDALQSIKGSKDATIAKLYDFVKNRVTMVPGKFEPEGALMVTIGDGTDSKLMMNARADLDSFFDHEDTFTDTIPGKQLSKMREEGASRADMLTEVFKWATWHEFGHVLDNASKQQLQLTMMDSLRDKFGDNLAGIKHWLGTNISRYAATNPGDAVAEMTALVIGGQHLPKEMEAVEHLIRGDK